METRFVRKKILMAATAVAVFVAVPVAKAEPDCGNHASMRLVSSVPLDGAVVEKRNRPALQFTFNYEVSPAGAIAGSVKLFQLIESTGQAKQRKAIAGRISVSGATVSFTPNRRLPPGVAFVLVAYPSKNEGYWPQPPGIYSEQPVGCRNIAVLKEEVAIGFTTGPRAK